MKKMRFPLLIVLVITVIGIVLGSFFDLQISTAIASPDNVFGLLVSAIGPTIGFSAVGILGGGFIAFARKGNYPIGLKILFYVLAACCLGVTIYYPGCEYFGINGFYGVVPEFVGYFIAIVPAVGEIILGYFLFKDYQNKYSWIIFVSIAALLLLALLATIPTLKDMIHRPRYRLISTTDQVSFHEWWEPCKDYKELIEAIGTNKDNFKSYPSGHTAETSILLVTTTFLPLIHEKFKKVQLPLFIGSTLLVMLVAFARILAAAHFLSDVSTGAFIVLTLLFIANEVIMRIKALQLENQASSEEQVQ